jgi:hypothetical protein
MMPGTQLLFGEVSAAAPVWTGEAALQWVLAGRLAAVEQWNYSWREPFCELPTAERCLESLGSLTFFSNDHGSEAHLHNRFLSRCRDVGVVCAWRLALVRAGPLPKGDHPILCLCKGLWVPTRLQSASPRETVWIWNSPTFSKETEQVDRRLTALPGRHFKQWHHQISLL